MSKPKPWDEEWRISAHNADTVVGGYVPAGVQSYSVEPGGVLCSFNAVVDANTDEESQARAKFIAAAPQLVRALLAVEWTGAQQAGLGDGCDPCCPECFADASPWDPQTQRSVRGQHDPGCQLDAALTAAGLATQDQRDAARKGR